MGLDMYLKKRKKNTNEKFENVMYWRKANQIRQWFVNNLDDKVENCEFTNVTKDNLIALVNTCNIVLEDHSKAEKLLPTSSGFFFGGTEYDESYFIDLETTVEKVHRIIDETDWETEEVYYCEWW